MLLGVLREARSLDLFESYLIVNPGNSLLKETKLVKRQSGTSTN